MGFLLKSFFLLIMSSGILFAQEDLAFQLPIQFTSSDRVLVIAPHPDDEAIATGGILQQALKAGALTRTCLLTNGENNEFSFIVYEKRIVLKPKEFVRLGEVRRQEALAGARVLGVDPDQVISLGYPDYGTMEVFLKYWGDTKPFRSMLSRVRKVPFSDVLSPGAAYIGDNILRDITQVIAEFKPTKIFVSHPADVNRDHRAAYLFTRVALWDLDARPGFKQPQLFPYIVHIPGWPAPRGYHPQLPLTVPSSLERGQIKWVDQPLDMAEIGKKYDAINAYVSQVRCAPKYLVTFARRNELFGDFVPLIVERQMASDMELAWTHIGVKPPLKSRIKGDATDHFSDVAYAWQGNYLVIKVGLKRPIDKQHTLSVFLMGYRTGVDFAQMPKINLVTDGNSFFLKDKRKRSYPKDVLFIKKDKEFIFKVPLSVLGNPQRILSCANTVVYNMTLDETAWRVLELK